MSYGIYHFLFGCLFFPGFPGLCVSLLASMSDSSCCSESEDSEIRICEFIPATACVLSHVFLYSESISGLDALHTVHNSGFVHTLPKEQASSAQQILFLRCHDTYTLACKARPSFDGCRTSLSVSLSLLGESLLSTHSSTRPHRASGTSKPLSSQVQSLPENFQTSAPTAFKDARQRLSKQDLHKHQHPTRWSWQYPFTLCPGLRSAPWAPGAFISRGCVNA